MTTKNLWPEFSSSETEAASPKEVIQRAGDGLKERTNGLVEFTLMHTSVADGNVHIVFSLYTPRISYMYPFLTAHFPVVGMYPVQLDVDKTSAPVMALDEERLVESLARIFNSESTVSTIRQLMALSK